MTLTPQETLEAIKSFRRPDLNLCLSRLRLSKSGNKSQVAATLLHACGVGSNGQQLAGMNDHDVNKARSVVQERQKELVSEVSSKRRSAASSGSTRASTAKPSPSSEIRCICLNNIEYGSMIRCTSCGVWQHACCMGLGNDPTEEAKAKFFCEQCRFRNADPFKQLFSVLLVAKVKDTGRRTVMSNGKFEDMIEADKKFFLKDEDVKALKHDRKLELHVCSMMLGDETPFRFHWPLNTQLRINQIPYRVYNRGPSTKLGANGRDTTFSVGLYCVVGRNTVLLNAADKRQFVLMLALVRRRTLKDVQSMMAPTESLGDAVARVRQAVCGTGGDDDDDDIVTLSTVLSLKCPLTGLRVQRPARFRNVSGLSVFDLEAFLNMAHRTGKWQCPQTMKNSTVENLQVDAYVERVLAAVKDTPVAEIELSPEGLWRPAGSTRPFIDVTDDADLSSLGGNVKQEASGNGAINTIEDDDDDDEAAELRRTAEELTQMRSSAKAPDSDSVIVISDSSDDEPESKRPRAQASSSDGAESAPSTSQPALAAQEPPAAGAQAARDSSVLRFRIPVRRRTSQPAQPQSLHAAVGGPSAPVNNPQDNGGSQGGQAAMASAALGQRAGLFATPAQPFQATPSWTTLPQQGFRDWSAPGHPQQLQQQQQLPSKQFFAPTLQEVMAQMNVHPFASVAADSCSFHTGAAQMPPAMCQPNDAQQQQQQQLHLPSQQFFAPTLQQVIAQMNARHPAVSVAADECSFHTGAAPMPPMCQPNNAQQQQQQQLPAKQFFAPTLLQVIAQRNARHPAVSVAADECSFHTGAAPMPPMCQPNNAQQQQQQQLPAKQFFAPTLLQVIAQRNARHPAVSVAADEC
eukprot:CAMPEP_0177597016 /NCGR_PEP_ID=MMETSP0419_2-20121207/11466_1 /TAXON_ID=582737 /ORGANISM="Tetraselmis sp., Strain GSL018" /LENGTH=857 /DNA_ID=CAMNT_0019089117 /DNA_START=251 /DNA_END=2821 /DNA_ORIENTATION=-